MRIISGQRRGHKIDGPKANSRTRPTSDLVRESMFNILRDEVEDRAVIDLFAGTGALGLEALSRGARHAVFIERDRDGAGLIRRNLATLRYEDRGSVVVADAYRWARSYQAIDDEPVIVFVDPPYRDYESRRQQIGRLFADLIGRLPADSIVVAELRSGIDHESLPEPDRWDLRRYGGTQVGVRRIEPGDSTQDAAEGVAGDEPADESFTVDD